MRKTFALFLILIVTVSVVPFASAGTAKQFAGCADEVGEQYGARYRILQVNGLTFSVTAIGVDGFDPELTVIDQEGNTVACNRDSDEAAEMAVNLPTVQVAAEGAAQVEVTVPGDQGRFDFEVIVTGADNTSGEFVLFYQGAEVYGSTNVDSFNVITTAEQAEAEVPLGLYVVNLQRPQIAVMPEVSFVFGEQKQTCSKSSADSLCQGEHEDLTGYDVTLSAEKANIALNGDDVMLYYELGGDPSEFTVEVSSYQQASFGPYTLIMQSAVVYPEAE